MRLIDQSVEVIYPRTLEEGVGELKRVELAVRNCWRSEGRITDDSYKSFIDNLMKRGHLSPLEFGFVTLRLITGRDVMAELTRHRVASFCVQSQRFVDESKDDGIAFIKPLFYRDHPDNPDHAWEDKNFYATTLWEDRMELSEQAYRGLRNLGLKNEDARKVLPNSTATTIFMGVNLRELLHIYDLRSSPAAYPEMRDLMAKLKTEVDKVLPGFLPEKEVQQ